MDWRHRAEELRTLAESMRTPAARSSLLAMAAALEHHAGNLEETADKFARARETAAATVRRQHVPSQRLARRPGAE